MDKREEILAALALLDEYKEDLYNTIEAESFSGKVDTELFTTVKKSITTLAHEFQDINFSLDIENETHKKKTLNPELRIYDPTTYGFAD